MIRENKSDVRQTEQPRPSAAEQPATDEPMITVRPRKTFDESLDIVIIIIIAALVAAIVCAFLVNFNVTAQINVVEFTSNTVIVAGCTASLYILLRSLTIRKGRKTEVWQNAREKLQETIDGIVEDNLARRAGEYCREWETQRLRDDRMAQLDVVGISIYDYEKTYCLYNSRELAQKFPDLTTVQRKVIERVNKIKRRRYDPSYLITRHDASRRHSVSPSEGVNSSVKNKLSIGQTVVNVLVTSGLSVGLFSDIIINYSTEALIACIVKLAITAIFGVIGMMGGFNFATKTEVEEMLTRTDELLNFRKWCEGKAADNSDKNKVAPEKESAVGEPDREDVISSF